MLQLIPGSSDATATDSFAIDQKKGTWQPTAAHLRTKSFPTPYAQAEMMAFVLGGLSLDHGARQPQPELENPRLQQSFERWRLLLLGLVLREITIETVDLRRPEVDNFGAMLADLRPECRFLGLLRDARRMGGEGRKLLVGATDPNCLLWCAPRAYRQDYWSELKTRIDASADRGLAMSLLAEWRAVLEQNGVWAPGHEKAPPWMKALQVLLGDATSPGGLLTNDARLVGPVQLSIPSRAGAESEDLIVYLPVREPGWNHRFAELLFFQPVRREAGTVDLVDPNGRAVVSVRMSPRDLARESAGVARGSGGGESASVAGFELLAGVGRLEGGANVARGVGQAHWLEDHASAQGYRSLVLNPLMMAAARSQGRQAIRESDVLAFSILYPDTIRLVVAQTHGGVTDGVRIHLSREVANSVPQGVLAPQTGTAMARWEPGSALPTIVAIPGATGTLSVGLVERYGPADRAVDVGELRALGLSLWLYFLGDAELRSDGVRLIWSADEGKELFGRVLTGTTERPLEVLRDALQAARGEVERQRARDRLATLQRFRATWRALGEGDPERPEVQIARLGRVAAETFVEWALAGSGLVAGSFGLRASAPAEHYVITPTVRLPLYRDALGRGE